MNIWKKFGNEALKRVGLNAPEFFPGVGRIGAVHIDGPKNKEEWLSLGCANEDALHFAAGVLDNFIVPLLTFLLVRSGANV